MNGFGNFTECLNEKHSATILMYLLIYGPVLKSTLYHNISTNPRMPLKLLKLQNAGLVSISANRFEKNATTVKLTALRKETAELLFDCACIVSDQERRYNLRIKNGLPPR